MGWTRIKPQNHKRPRTFLYSEAFYKIYRKRRQIFIFGTRPEGLEGIESINQRVLRSHQTYLRRLANFPPDKAEYYKRLQETTGVKTVRGLSEITGEDWSHIAKLLRNFKNS